MAFKFENLNAEEMVANNGFKSQLNSSVKVAWRNLLHCNEEYLSSIFCENDKKFYFPKDQPILATTDELEKRHVYDHDSYYLDHPEIGTYPSYIHSPLRVLDNTCFSKAIDELEQIITRGDMSFKAKSLGLSAVDDQPFVLSFRKADVSIVRVNSSIFESLKNANTLSCDSCACYLPEDKPNKKSPTIMINAEMLEDRFDRIKDSNKREAELIKAYQFDILEMFAYSIRELYPNAYEGGDIHFALDFALQYMKNFGKSVDLYYKTVHLISDFDEVKFLAIEEKDLETLRDILKNLHKSGYLTDDAFAAGILYDDNLLDIDWREEIIKQYGDDYLTKDYVRPLSVDLKHPYPWWAIV